MKRTLICLVLGVLVLQHGFLASTGICLAAKKSDLAKSLTSALRGTDGLAEIARRLAAIKDDAELDQTISGLGQGIAEKKNYDPAAKLVDLLLAQGDLRSSVIAGSLLVAIIDNVELSNFAVSKDILGYPDSLCDRAVILLDQPDPVVQALGEWALALRVKKQGRSAKDLKPFFQQSANPPAWYRKWKARNPQFDLRDDYARQLIQIGRHYSPAAVREAVERTAARMAKLAADRSSTAADEARLAYQEALSKARAAVAGDDLAQGHAAYLILRVGVTITCTFCRATPPRDTSATGSGRPPARSAWSGLKMTAVPISRCRRARRSTCKRSTRISANSGECGRVSRSNAASSAVVPAATSHAPKRWSTAGRTRPPRWPASRRCRFRRRGARRPCWIIAGTSSLSSTLIAFPATARTSPAGGH